MSGEPRVSRDDLAQAGQAYLVLLHALDDEGIDKAIGLEAWALSWGARLMDAVDVLLREAGAKPDDGGRDILRLWLDKDGLMQMAIDVPREGDGRQDESGGIQDEAHFAALYSQILTGIGLLQQLHARMKGTTGVH